VLTRCKMMQSAIDALKSREESREAADSAERDGDANLAGELRIRAELFDQFAEWMIRESASLAGSEIDLIAQSIALKMNEVADGELE
jgi:hypothetical protein